MSQTIGLLFGLSCVGLCVTPEHGFECMRFASTHGLWVGLSSVGLPVRLARTHDGGSVRLARSLDHWSVLPAGVCASGQKTQL